MKKLSLLLLAVLMILLLIPMLSPVYAENKEKELGEVLYHQDFSYASAVEYSGVKIGNLSSEKSYVNCSEDFLDVNTYDDGRVYVILPEFERTESYTVEFDFRFDKITKSNGYVSVLLTCRGDEPTNITAVAIRANGTVDDFSAPDDALATDIRNGELIHVQIPVKSGIIHEMFLSSANAECRIERDRVLVIEIGNMGFGIRNADVEIPEIYVVNGIGYTEKKGYYADTSFSDDPLIGTGENESHSPNTFDIAMPLTLIAATVAIAFRRKR